MKSLMMRIPGVGPLAKYLYFRFVATKKRFTGSENYWKSRYAAGKLSGSGSYAKLAEFKASFLNGFVREHGIDTVLELGSGDGNQLTLAAYPRYTGLDISPEAIRICRELFAGNENWSFELMDDYDGATAELAISLDVIYHLTENDVFERYMCTLFDASSRYVVVYSSDTDTQRRVQAPHVRHRRFTDWVERERPGFRLIEHVPNPYPYRGDDTAGSFADFYVFERFS